MSNIKHFVEQAELRFYEIQDKKISLVVNETVFPPSSHGSLFAQHIQIVPNESVIDIGTGSGMLAIAAAKLGAREVFATDVSLDAIKVAQANALLNDVEINFVQGSYFAGLEKKFDVIIANLPQEVVHPHYLNRIGDLQQTIDGGRGGNEILINFLDIAHKYMHSKSRLYIPVITLANYAQTIKSLLDNYNVRLVAFSSASAKEFVEEFYDDYKKLTELGLVSVFRKDGECMVYEFVFELIKK